MKQLTVYELVDTLVDACDHRAVLMGILDYDPKSQEAARVLVAAIGKNEIMKACGIVVPSFNEAHHDSQS